MMRSHRFATTDRASIYGFTDPPNRASARVMEKAGMTPSPDAAAARGLVAYVAHRPAGAGGA